MDNSQDLLSPWPEERQSFVECSCRSDRSFDGWEAINSCRWFRRQVGLQCQEEYVSYRGSTLLNSKGGNFVWQWVIQKLCSHSSFQDGKLHWKRITHRWESSLQSPKCRDKRCPLLMVLSSRVHHLVPKLHGGKKTMCWVLAWSFATTRLWYELMWLHPQPLSKA